MGHGRVVDHLTGALAPPIASGDRASLELSSARPSVPNPRPALVVLPHRRGGTTDGPHIGEAQVAIVQVATVTFTAAPLGRLSVTPESSTSHSGGGPTVMTATGKGPSEQVAWSDQTDAQRPPRVFGQTALTACRFRSKLAPSSGGAASLGFCGQEGGVGLWAPRTPLAGAYRVGDRS